MSDNDLFKMTASDPVVDSIKVMHQGAVVMICPICHGTGEYKDKPCEACNHAKCAGKIGYISLARSIHLLTTYSHEFIMEHVNDPSRYFGVIEQQYRHAKFIALFNRTVNPEPVYDVPAGLTATEIALWIKAQENG